MSDDIPPHLAMLSPQTRAAIIADAKRRIAEAPPPTPESVERLRRLVQEFIVPRPGPDIEDADQAGETAAARRKRKGKAA